MRKFLVLIFLLVGICQSYADPMFFLLGKGNINLELDFSNTIVDDMQKRDFEDLTKAAEMMWYRLLIDELNEEVDEDNLIFGDFSDSSFTVLCHVVSISVNGSTQLDVRFVDTETLEERKKVQINGRGGVFGSFANLVGDAMKRCGENLGELIHDGLTL